MQQRYVVWGSECSAVQCRIAKLASSSEQLAAVRSKCSVHCSHCSDMTHPSFKQEAVEGLRHAGQCKTELVRAAAAACLRTAADGCGALALTKTPPPSFSTFQQSSSNLVLPPPPPCPSPFFLLPKALTVPDLYLPLHSTLVLLDLAASPKCTQTCKPLHSNLPAHTCMCVCVYTSCAVLNTLNILIILCIYRYTYIDL